MKRKYRNVRIGLLAVLFLSFSLGIFFSAPPQIDAAGNQFTLGALPTPRHEVSVTPGNTVHVQSATEILNNWGNPSVSRIVMDNDIFVDFSIAATIFAITLNRDLQLDGNGFTLSFNDFGSFSALVSLANNAAGDRTFHLRNINIQKNARPSTDQFISGGNNRWEIILENVTFDRGVNLDWIINNGTDINLFLRGNVTGNRFTSGFARGIRDVVFEVGSQVTLAATQPSSSIFFDNSAPFDGTIYFGPNARANLEGGTGIPVIFPWQNFDFYSGSSVSMSKTADEFGVMEGLHTNQVYRIDSGATFNMTNGIGPVYDDAGFAASILVNPGGVVNFVGVTNTRGIVVFSNPESRMILNSPGNYNIQNNTADAPALYNETGGNGDPLFQIIDSNISVWNQQTSVTGSQTEPSPFVAASLITDGSGLLAGSTPVLDTMEGGWDTAAYARIAFAIPPVLDVEDKIIAVGKTKNLNAQVTPVSATLSYQSLNPELATVDGSGNVTGVGVGLATILVRATGSDQITVSQRVTVDVEPDNPPVLTTPGFTEIALGSSFDPMEGVTAYDPEDGDLTGAITVEGTVNTSVAGLYPLVYSVTDSTDNTVTETRVVLVNDGSFAVGDEFVMQARDFTRRVGQVDSSPAVVKAAAHVRVYDKTSGLLVGEPVQIDSLGGYNPTVGDYTISFSIVSEPTTVKDITARVIAGESPVISAPTFTQIDQDSSFDPLAGITAEDEEDGDLTAQLEVSGQVDSTIPGIYPLTYSVTDSDQNMTILERVVLVTDGSWVVGDRFILTASDFSRRIGQVDTSAVQVKADAQVAVYDKATGSPVNEPVQIDSLGGYSPQVGSYTIAMHVTSDPLASRSITATVITGDSPIITATAFKEIMKGSSFDPLYHVTAYDTEDGNLTGAIEVTGTVDVNTPGFYPLTYRVTDSDSNTTILERTVLVNDESYGIGDNFILQAQDFVIELSAVDLAESAIKAAAQVQVFEKLSGTLVSEPVQIDSLGGFGPAAGTYLIQFSVVSDPTATRTIEAYVTLGQPPEITTPGFTEIPVGTSFDPLAGVTASDPEDGDLTASIVVSGSVDKNTAGVYALVYRVSDSSGNTAEVERGVLVNDGSFQAGSVYILKATDFTLRVGQVDVAENEVKAAAQVAVYEKVSGQAVSRLVLVDSLGGYAPQVGSYTITMSVDPDPAALRSITATVVAGDAPEIQAPSFTEISLGASFDPLAGVTADDNEDGDLTAGLEVSGEVDSSIAGVYTLTYSVTDSDSNTTIFERVVLVTDGNWAVGDDFILKASNFSRRVGQVDTADSQVKLDAQVVVYDKVTGVQVNEPVQIDSLGGYAPQVGSYTITMRVTADPLANRSITATVVTGDVPIIAATAFKEIMKGSSFDPLYHVTAYDTEDGNLTGDIEVSGTVNVNVPGFYPLTYQVTDSDSNTTILERTVLVNDENYSIGDNFVLQAQDFVIELSAVDMAESAIKAAAQVQVFDKFSGTLVSEPVQIDSLGGFGPVAGSYLIQFSITSDPSATRTIEAYVTLGQPPVITTPGFTEIALGTSFNPLAGVTASDPEDGDLTAAIEVSGTVDVNGAGVYALVYRVSDSSGNRTEVERGILVNDGSFQAGSAYILKAADFTLRVGQVDVREAEIKADAQVAVYEKASGQAVSRLVQIDSLGGYTNQVGNYTITMSVDPDPAAVRSITATVVTGDFPLIQAPAFTEISLGASFDPLAGVTATDDEDGDVTAALSVQGSVDVNRAGVYVLSYSVTDSDQNTTVLERVVLVTDGNWAVGDRFILKASDFSRRVGQVDTTEVEVKRAAQVAVYDKETGGRVNEPVTIVDLGGYRGEVGSFSIIFRVTSDALATQSITATVETGNFPVISAPAFSEVPLNGTFDPLAQVTAEDIEDGDLTALITLTGDVDTSTPGLESILYRVEDSDGNVTTFTRSILVNDGTYSAGENFILKASDFSRRIVEVDTGAAAVKAAAQVQVLDKLTGEPVTEPVQIDSLGGYTNQVGTYTILFRITSDPTASRSVVAEVVAGSMPTLSGVDFAKVVLGGQFDPRKNVTAFDEEDGDITANIVITGAADVNTPGVYLLTYSITDTDGNLIEKDRVVLVNDDSFSVGNHYLLAAQDFTVDLGAVDTGTAAIKAAAQIRVYNKATGAVANPGVQIDNLGGFGPQVGTYQITFSVIGDALATRTIEAKVTLGQPPVITTPGFTEISLGAGFDPLAGVTASDPEDGDLTAFIEVDGVVDVNQADVYSLVYRVTDSSGNQTTASRGVLVNDGTFTAGAALIIQAQDFVRRVGQVNTSLSAIQTAAEARTFMQKNGREIQDELSLDDLGGYTSQVGIYQIALSIAEDPAAQRRIQAQVITGEMPVLTVPTFTEISKGSSFNPRSGISASDLEDGNITAQISINGSVNTAVAGLYSLTYSITDSDRNTVSASRVVLVNDGNYSTGSLYVIQAVDFSKRSSEVDVSLTAIKAAAQVRVYDKSTALEVTREVQVDNVSGYSVDPGVYNIQFSVAADPLAMRTVRATVIPNDPPVIEGQTFSEIKKGSTFDPMAGISARDFQNQDITSRVLVVGTVDSSRPGPYKLDYTVTDDFGKQASLTRIVLVNDDSFRSGQRYLLRATDFSLRAAQVDTSLSAILKAAQVQVYDRTTASAVEQNVIIKDLGGYKAQVGSYNITLQVEADPQALRTITVQVTGGNAPVFEGLDFVALNRNQAFDPLKNVTATDKEDGLLTSEIQVEGKVDITISGIYVLTYRVTDSDGNTTASPRAILVKGDGFVTSEDYIIQAKNFRIGKSKANLTDKDMIALADVRVFSISDVQYLVNPEITVDKKDFSPQLGTYSVTFTFNPSITVKATVYDDTKMTKTGEAENSLSLVFGLVLLGSSVILTVAKKKRFPTR